MSIDYVEPIAPASCEPEFDKTCHTCGHVHSGTYLTEKRQICGEDMGGAGKCLCEVEVLA